MVFFHFFETTHEHFVFGGYAVSMFVVISGMFLFDSLETDYITEATDYIKKRYLRFIPYTAIATYLLYVGRKIFTYVSGNIDILHIRDFILPLDFIVDIGSISIVSVLSFHFPYNGPGWTIAALFIVESLLYLYCSTFKKPFKDVIIPTLILISCYIIINKGNTIVTAIPQVLLAVCLGYYALKLANKIQTVNFNKNGIIFVTIFEVLCNIVAFWILLKSDNANCYWLLLPLFVVIAGISYAGISYVEILIKKTKIASYLAELSLGIYLIHWIPHSIFKMLYTDPYEKYSHKFMFLFIVLVLAVIYCILVKTLIKLSKKFITILKDKMIANTN